MCGEKWKTCMDSVLLTPFFVRLSVLSFSRGYCFHSCTFLLCNLTFCSGLDVVDSGLQSLSQKNCPFRTSSCPRHLLMYQSIWWCLACHFWDPPGHLQEQEGSAILFGEAMSTSLCETSTPQRFEQIVLSWQYWRARPSQLCFAMQVDNIASRFTSGSFDANLSNWKWYTNNWEVVYKNSVKHFMLHKDWSGTSAVEERKQRGGGRAG